MLLELLTLAQTVNPKIEIPDNPKPTPIVQIEKPKTYNVKEGDTLTKIAKKKHVPVKRLWSYNRQIKNQDILEVGQLIKLPADDAKLKPRAFVIPKPVASTTLDKQTNVGSSNAARISINGRAPAGWYQVGWCTYGAWRLAPWVGKWHNANTWDDMARADGFVVNTSPSIGAVFVDNGGSMGHVGVVIGVNDKNITVKEMNYKGFGVWSTRTVPKTSFVYIHP